MCIRDSTIDNLVLYIIDGQIEITANITSHDNKNHKYENIVFVSHDVAKKFKVTKHNLPWIESVSYTHLDVYKRQTYT